MITGLGHDVDLDVTSSCPSSMSHVLRSQTLQRRRPWRQSRPCQIIGEVTSAIAVSRRQSLPCTGRRERHLLGFRSRSPSEAGTSVLEKIPSPFRNLSAASPRHLGSSAQNTLRFSMLWGAPKVATICLLLKARMHSGNHKLRSYATETGIKTFDGLVAVFFIDLGLMGLASQINVMAVLSWLAGMCITTYDQSPIVGYRYFEYGDNQDFDPIFRRHFIVDDNHRIQCTRKPDSAPILRCLEPLPEASPA